MLLERPTGCRGCSLDPIATGFINPEGTGSLGVCIVGESAGWHEADAGLPFRPGAPAGSVLAKAIRLAGFDRSQFLITNLCQCQPPNNKLDHAPWEFSAISHCRSAYMDRLVATHKPKVFLALGNLPLRELTGFTGKKRNISYMRGYVLPCTAYPGALVVGSFHPSFLRRGAMHLLRLLVGDIKRAVAVALAQFTEFDIDPQVPRGFNLVASLDEFERFYQDAKSSGLPIMGDLETDDSLKMDEAELFTPPSSDWGGDDDEDEDTDPDAWLNDRLDRLAIDSPITQTQWSTRPGEVICTPWTPDYARITRKLMALPNIKIGHNWLKFDRKVLRMAGVEVYGPQHDTLWLYHHYQPDSPAHLQAVAQQVGARFPWKHMSDSHLAFYGALDVDNLHPIWQQIPNRMKQERLPDVHAVSLWDGYQRHVINTNVVLEEVSTRGIPIDNDERLSFGEDLDKMLAELFGQVQSAYPVHLLNNHPKNGFVRAPKDTTGLVLRSFTVEQPTEEVVEIPCTCKKKCKKCGGTHVVQKTIKHKDRIQIVTVERWCELLPFLPNSSDQVKRYILWRGHPMPRNPAGKGEDKNKPTTGKVGLEQLHKKTGDELYKLILDYRAATKLRSTYVDGWAPAEDRRTHPTFVFSTATMQLGSRAPNCQNAVGAKAGLLGMRFKRVVRAETGRRLLEIDYSGLHAFMVGYLAEDTGFMRLSQLGIHDYVAAHLLQRTLAGKRKRVYPEDETLEYIQDLDQWLALPDGPLGERLSWIKTHWKTFRNIVKQGVHGSNFGVSAWGLQRRYPNEFPKVADAQMVITMLNQTFPVVAQWKENIKDLARRQGRLMTPYGAVRYFTDVVKRREVEENYEPKWGERLVHGRFDKKLYAEGPGDDAEKAIAYLPAACSHQYMRDAMLLVHEAELDREFRLINQVHDSLLFEPDADAVDRAWASVRPLMEHESRCLVHPVLAPTGLRCYTEASTGTNWAPRDPKLEWSLDGNPDGMGGLK